MFQTLVGQLNKKGQHQIVKVEPYDEVTEMFVISEFVQNSGNQVVSSQWYLVTSISVV